MEATERFRFVFIAFDASLSRTCARIGLRMPSDVTNESNILQLGAAARDGDKAAARRTLLKCKSNNSTILFSIRLRL